MSLSLGGTPGVGGGGSGQVVMLAASVSALSVSAGLAFYFLNNRGGNSSNSNQNSNMNTMGVNQMMPSPVPVLQQQMASADGRQVTLPSPPPSPMGEPGLDGRYMIKFGALSLTVDPSTCDKTYVWFDESASGDAMRFNLRSVPGYEGTYTIESEDRIFSKGCGRAFLTVSPMCGQITLEDPGLKDRQYWRMVKDPVKGGFAIMSVHCYNKRKPAYMISSGQNAGMTNQPRFVSSPSAVYTLVKAL